MKKLISIILATLIICPLLTACGGKGMGIGKVEQTNKELTIKTFAYQQQGLNPVINAYMQKYPDVKLNIETISGSEMKPDEFTKKLTTEIMGGKGPDLVCLDDTNLRYCDVNKMMSTGVFADLNEFFDKDTDFHIEDYNKTVLDAGVYKDKRYVLPVGYSIPTMLSTESIVKETGFNISNCKNYFDLMAEIVKYLNANKNTSASIRLFRNSMTLYNYHSYMGIKMLDYKSKKVNIDTPEFKKASEYYKAIYPQEKIDTIEDKDSNLLKEKKIIFAYHAGWLGFDSFFADSMLLSSLDKPFPLIIRDLKGGVQSKIVDSVAVRSNSSNKQNAYNFIKLMISPEIVEKNICFNIPIRYSSVKNLFSKYTKGGLVHIDDSQNVIPLKALSQEYCDDYMKMVESITGAYFRNPWEKKFYEIMEPYYKGEKSYEECIKNAKDQMEIYITE